MNPGELGSPCNLSLSLFLLCPEDSLAQREVERSKDIVYNRCLAEGLHCLFTFCSFGPTN